MMSLRSIMQRDVNAWRGISAVTLAGCGAMVAIVFAVMAMLVLHQDA